MISLFLSFRGSFVGIYFLLEGMDLVWAVRSGGWKRDTGSGYWWVSNDGGQGTESEREAKRKIWIKVIGCIDSYLTHSSKQAVHFVSFSYYLQDGDDLPVVGRYIVSTLF